MTEMQPHEPFAEEYTKDNSTLEDNEMRLLDQGLKIRDADGVVREAEADDFATQAAAEQPLVMAKARRKVLREQWTISEDKLELYSGCSSLSKTQCHTCVGCNKCVSPSGVYACNADLTYVVAKSCSLPLTSARR